MIQKHLTLEDIDHDLRMFDEDQELPAPETDIEEIAAQLRETFKTKTHIQPTREYVYGEDVVIYFDDQGHPIPIPISRQLIFAAWIRVSFLSDYSAIVWKKSEDGQDWIVVVERELPSSLSAVNAKLHSLMGQSGFKIIPDDLLYQYLSTRVSQLDGSAASVHAALFSELD
jgi:hypothetical protein